MRKHIQTLWLPLIFSLLLPLNLQAQNGWVAYSNPGGGAFHFANSNYGLITGKYIYSRTTNGGNTWSSDSVPYPHNYNDYNSVYFINPNTGWLGMSYEVFSFPIGITGGSTYKTTNGGMTWGPAINAGPVRDIQFLNENTGYTATGGSTGFWVEGGVGKTTNGGMNWSGIYGGYYFNDVSFINVNTGWAIGFYGDDVGTYITLMIRTTNGGNNWTTLIRDSVPTAPYDPLKNVQFTDANTGYLLKTKLYKSTNGGNNWSMLDTNVYGGRFLRKFYFINNDTGWVTAGPNGKIFRTNNGGLNWEIQSIPTSDVYGNIYFTNAATGWVIADGSTILRTGTGGVTSIEPVSSEVPSSFILHQNYPNPFNPETKIKFEIPKQGFVSLKVYDMSGKEVSDLFNGELTSGVYEYSFNGSGLGSGVYFYKLQSGDLVETRRMVLVK